MTATTDILGPQDPRARRAQVLAKPLTTTPEDVEFLNFRLPRKEDGMPDLRGVSPSDMDVMKGLSMDGSAESGVEPWERLQQLGEVRRMGVEEADLPEPDQKLLDYYHGELLPHLSKTARLKADFLNKDPLTIGAGNLARMAEPYVFALPDLMNQALYGVVGMVAGTEARVGLNEAVGLSEDAAGAEAPRTGVMLRALLKKLDGSETPFSDLYRETVDEEQAAEDATTGLGTVKAVTGLAGEVRAMFGKTILGQAFGKAGTLGSRAAGSLIKGQGKFSQAARWYAGNAAGGGALYGTIASLRDSVDPETGQQKDMADMLGHGVVEAALFPVFVGLSQVASKAAAGVLRPGEKRMSEAVEKFASSNKFEGVDPNTGRSVIRNLDDYREYWGKRWVAEGMPGFKISDRRALGSLVAQAGIEGVGFSAIDSEFRGMVAESIQSGNWAEPVKILLTNMAGMGILHYGSAQAAYEGKRNGFPPIAPGARETTAKDATKVEKGDPPADLTEAGFRWREGERYSLEGRDDLGFEWTGGELVLSENLKAKLPEGVDAETGLRHLLLRNRLEARRALAGVGEDVTIDGERVVVRPGPEGLKRYMFQFGRTYEADLGSKVWKTSDSVDRTELPPVDAQQAQALDNFARQVLQMPLDPVMRDTLVELVRTLAEVPASADRGVAEALDIANREVLRQMPDAESMQRAVMEMAAVAAGFKSEAKALADVQAEVQAKLAQAQSVYGDKTQGVTGKENKPKVRGKEAADVQEALGGKAVEDAKQPAPGTAEAMGVGAGKRGPKPKKPEIADEPTKPLPGTAEALGVGSGKKGPKPKPQAVEEPRDAEPAAEKPAGEPAAPPAVEKPAAEVAETPKPKRTAREMIDRIREVDAKGKPGEEGSPARAKRDLARVDAVQSALSQAAAELGESAPAWVRSSPSRSGGPLREAAKKLGVKGLNRDANSILLDMLDKVVPGAKPKTVDSVKFPERLYRTFEMDDVAVRQQGGFPDVTFTKKGAEGPAEQIAKLREFMDDRTAPERFRTEFGMDRMDDMRNPAELSRERADAKAAAQYREQKGNTVEQGYADLKAKAKLLGIKGYNRMKLDALREAVREAEAKQGGAAYMGDPEVRQIYKAATDTVAMGKFGQGLAFISQAYDALPAKAKAGMTLPQFKQKLLDLAAEGRISLVRADLVEAMDKTDVKMSEVKDPTGIASWHMIRVEDGASGFADPKVAGAVAVSLAVGFVNPWAGLATAGTLAAFGTKRGRELMRKVVGEVADPLYRRAKGMTSDQEAAQELVDRALKVNERTGVLYGDLEAEGRAIQEQLTRGTKESREAHEWFKEAAISGEKGGVGYEIDNALAYHDSILDLQTATGIPKRAKAVLEAMRDLNFKQWNLLEKVGAWMWTKGGLQPVKADQNYVRMQRIWGTDGRDLMLTQEGRDAMAKAVADIKQNGTTYDEARAILDAVAEKMAARTGNFEASEAQDAREQSREIRVMPNRLRINGEWVDILLTEPFKFVVASSKYLASRVAFIEEFGQKLPKEVVETAKAAGQRLPKDRQTDLFDRFVKGANKDHEARKFINEMTRAMNGLDITDPVIDATSEMARANRRILRPLTGLWSVLRLSGAPTVIVNVLEPFNTLATHVGWTPTLKGFHDVWGAYSKWHTGDGTEWRALLARARKAGVVFKEPPRLPEAPWDARKGDRWDSTLEWASFASMPQKVVNSLNELQAFRATEILRDTFSGKPAELAGLRMVDMPSDIAKRLQEGKGTEADWLHVIRTMPQWTQGTGRLTEQSRFQQNRYTRTWLKFLTFARNYARYNADFAKLGTKIASGKAEAGDVQVFGRYLAGKGVVGVPAYLLTQTLIHMANGLLLSDADDAGQITANFVEELRDYMIAQELAGPGLASVAKWITGQQSGNIASQAARVFAPTSIAYEAWEAATASGKYTNEHWSERAGMWAMSQVPILNQAKKFISAVSGEEQPEFRVARSRYYDYLNEIGEGPPADRSGYKEFTAIMRDFRDSFWKAGHDRGTVSRDDLRDILREAAGVSDKGWDSVAASLRSRKFLSALDKEQRDEFQSRIGTDQYQLLLDHDRAIDKWIEWVNWRR